MLGRRNHMDRHRDVKYVVVWGVMSCVLGWEWRPRPGDGLRPAEPTVFSSWNVFLVTGVPSYHVVG